MYVDMQTPRKTYKSNTEAYDNTVELLKRLGRKNIAQA